MDDIVADIDFQISFANRARFGEVRPYVEAYVNSPSTLMPKSWGNLRPETRRTLERNARDRTSRVLSFDIAGIQLNSELESYKFSTILACAPFPLYMSNREDRGFLTEESRVDVGAAY